MNVPPEYCVGCEEVIQQTQEHIKNNFFYKDEYNRVVTCVVNNKYAFEKDLNFQPPWLLAGRVKPLGRDAQLVEKLYGCMKTNQLDLDEISFLNPSHMPLCKKESQAVYASYKSILKEVDEKREKPLHLNFPSLSGGK